MLFRSSFGLAMVRIVKDGHITVVERASED
jgi:hypothetical protein